jgi:hypothetical protein
VRRLVLAVIAAMLLSGPLVHAASYQRTDGTIVDPIQSVNGGDLGYSGNNLGPGALLLECE